MSIPLRLCTHIFSIFTDVCGDTMGTLGTEDREFPRAPPTSVGSYYSSIRKSFLVFWPSRDTARQPHPSLTGVTDLTGLVTRVDSLGDRNSHNFNLLKLRTANSLAVSLAGWLSSRPPSRETSEGSLGAL